jgi:hypothetical protein
MPDIEIVDRFGRRRRARRGEIPQDGERISIPHAMMDAVSREVADHLAAKYPGFSPTFSDGSIDHTSPHRPGYRFADVGDEARLRAEQAYEDKRRRLADAWRHKGEQRDVKDDQHAAAPRTQLTLDELRAAADAAYEARNERMRNAWRNKR